MDDDCTKTNLVFVLGCFKKKLDEYNILQFNIRL